MNFRDTPESLKCTVMLDFRASICVMPHIADQATVAENLRALKGRRRVSDAEIAAGTGLSRSAVNDRLTGRVRTQIEDLARFAAYFGVTVDQLLERPAEAAS